VSTKQEQGLEFKPQHHQKRKKIMKPVKNWGIGKNNRGGEFDQNTVSACMEFHSETPAKLRYASKKEKKIQEIR
jgi:hypothetical protein